MDDWVNCQHIDNGSMLTSFSFDLGDGRWVALCEECKEHIIGKMVIGDFFRKGLSGDKNEYCLHPH
jgi:hypothetical protein